VPYLVNANLTQTYGLLYPTIHYVFTSLRNGLSPNCRRYQINHLRVPNSLINSEETVYLSGGYSGRMPAGPGNLMILTRSNLLTPPYLSI
jgi:hypothetical protein